MPRLVAPEGIDVLPWFNSLKASFANLYLPNLMREQDWKGFACFLKSYRGFRGYVPDPSSFNDWRDWARIFYMNNQGG